MTDSDSLVAQMDADAAHSREADARQAEYFRRVLSDMRLAASSQLARHGIELQKARNAGLAARVSELRRVVHALEVELRTLDRLGDALQERLAGMQRQVATP
ncbi:hypothetical protein E4P42_22195 [Mycobacterium sp. PS03-16]|uniref:hypothetical protein n=1 Tax=Mycobacterium sp. PS03-16 TaxID=2559611 RepID=UPI0010739F6B|nr:hypothetical protein [Mycobacterium sp. PS03-16]TFV55550.1 hypothetical protein E4P42_22195 [Mycobacterium sp. PS03-16]